MAKYSRRKVIESLAAGSAALALTNMVSENPVEAKEGQAANAAAVARAFRGQHQPTPLPFDPAKLKGISEKLIRSHWENNYGGGRKGLEAVEQRRGPKL